MAANLLSDTAAPGFDDPLGMLSACHRRLERQLITLGRLQRHLPVFGCDNDARAAARAILKYFDQSEPNHRADEEQSLFPRLIEQSPPARGLIDELENEHESLSERWTRLRPLVSSIAAGQRANLSAKDVATLRRAYDAHIGREERELLPLAAASLDTATLASIGDEMSARRGVKT
jgi:hemerythrin-like domain-containing protein